MIGACHRLFRIGKSSGKPKHDAKARPIFHHKRETIEAHLAVVFTDLAVRSLIGVETGCQDPSARGPPPTALDAINHLCAALKRHWLDAAPY